MKQLVQTLKGVLGNGGGGSDDFDQYRNMGILLSNFKIMKLRMFLKVIRLRAKKVGHLRKR